MIRLKELETHEVNAGKADVRIKYQPEAVHIEVSAAGEKSVAEQLTVPFEELAIRAKMSLLRKLTAEMPEDMLIDWARDLLKNRGKAIVNIRDKIRVDEIANEPEPPDPNIGSGAVPQLPPRARSEPGYESYG